MHASFISMYASFIGSHALKGQKLLAQGIALGIMAISNAPCKGKSFVIIWFFEAFALTGRQVCKHIYPGRCPGLGASALSGRIGCDMPHLPRSFCPCRPDGFEIRPPAVPHPLGVPTDLKSVVKKRFDLSNQGICNPQIHNILQIELLVPH